MVRDFPLFGVGLGGFGDLFAHYQSPPWSEFEARKTHNDYLELLSEGGVVGFGLLLWFFVAVTTRLYRGLPVLPPAVLPTAAALVAAMAAMAFQEFFDFNLQIPANAILFTIILALAMRLIATKRLESGHAGPGRFSIRVCAAAVTVAALVLGVLAVGQDKVPYPYNLRIPRTPLEARATVLSHPGYARAHIWLLSTLEHRISTALMATELEAAVWDDPLNPRIRDVYARSLLLAGDPAGALGQMTLSVFNSPSLDNHFYLTPNYMKLLTHAQRDAVEKGLQMAVTKHFKNAVETLGGLYFAWNQVDKEAWLFTRAAANEPEPDLRTELLIAAGQAHASTDDPALAERELLAAAKLAPADYRPYAILATRVYAPNKDLTTAKAVLSEGILAGADPFELYVGMADASKTLGDLADEEAALSEAVSIAPANFEVVSRLASVYMRENRLDEAIKWWWRAAEIRPNSPEAYYQLGLAEEASYQYFAAERDLGHAVGLAPANGAIKSYLRDFQRRIAAGAIRERDASRPQSDP